MWYLIVVIKNNLYRKVGEEQVPAAQWKAASSGWAKSPPKNCPWNTEQRKMEFWKKWDSVPENCQKWGKLVPSPGPDTFTSLKSLEKHKWDFVCSAPSDELQNCGLLLLLREMWLGWGRLQTAAAPLLQSCISSSEKGKHFHSCWKINKKPHRELNRKPE